MAPALVTMSACAVVRSEDSDVMSELLIVMLPSALVTRVVRAVMAEALVVMSV